MSDRSVTLLELHLHDGIRLTAGGREFDLGRSGADDADDDGPDESEQIEVGSVGDADDGTSAVRTAGKLLIAIAIVGGLALAMRRYRGSDDDDAAEELDELAA